MKSALFMGINACTRSDLLYGNSLSTPHIACFSKAKL